MWSKIVNGFKNVFKVNDRVYYSEEPKPPLRPYHQMPHELYYPNAWSTPAYKMVTQGKYRSGYPEGIVIHFSAGNDSTVGTIKDMVKRKLVAFVIGKAGRVHQNFSLDEWGWHAGKSSWKGFQGGLNDDFVGIELINGGVLEQKGPYLYTWFKKRIVDYRFGTSIDNVKGGFYEEFTEHQEKSLIKLVVWLIQNSHGKISVENVVGHDEISPDRKSDPGWALSMTMPQFREKIKKELEKENAKIILTPTGSGLILRS